MRGCHSTTCDAAFFYDLQAWLPVEVVAPVTYANLLRSIMNWMATEVVAITLLGNSSQYLILRLAPRPPSLLALPLKLHFHGRWRRATSPGFVVPCIGWCCMAALLFSSGSFLILAEVSMARQFCNHVVMDLGASLYWGIPTLF